VAGSVVTLTTPLAHDHRGARDAAGSLTFLPHVGNLTRSVTIRSANPAGTRGHLLATVRANVDIEYVLLQDLGRTTIQPLDSATFDASGNVTHIGTNQIGRYSLHMHHLTGPTTPQSNGYQFTLIGNAIDSGGFKWGIVVHASHYGLIQQNVVYHAGGAAVMT